MSIPKVPYADRLEFWKLHHASITFVQAKKLCDFILAQKISVEHPLHVSLMTALHVLYGRPFKQRKEARISEEIVPNEYKGLHSSLIEMRDKIHAHADADGPRTAQDESFNKVVIRILDRKVRCEATMVFPRANRIGEIGDLSNSLAEKTIYHAEKIWKRHMKNEFVSDGEYEVNLAKDEDNFLKPISW